MTPATFNSLIVLGAGYAGQVVYKLVRNRKKSVFVTSREPGLHLGFAEAGHRLLFDLERPGTWTAIPAAGDLLWCFPAAPLDLVQQFAGTLHLASRRIIVFGSTSAYDVGGSGEDPPAWIDESAPIDLTKPRVQGEEFLRKECGAIILRVAGIYGPGRNPIDWIRTGRVGPSRKYVNLIHVEDLAAICLNVLARGQAGEAYNVSDGEPRTWASICREASERWNLSPMAATTDRGPGKRISNRKLLEKVDMRLQHPDLYAELERLEQR